MADNEDFFSDDDLDNIPTNTLDQLEQQAFTSTQRSKQFAKPLVALQKQVHHASSANRAGSLNQNLPWRPPQINRQPIVLSQGTRTGPPASAPEPPSSDYGFDDEDVIDLNEPSMTIQSASGNVSGQPSSNKPRYRKRASLDPETEAAFAAADAELDGQVFQQGPQYTSGGRAMDVSAMQARIAELEAEQIRLRCSEEQARVEARAKQGEIAIVRSNQEKLAKQYEARISVLQRLHAEDAARTKAELDSQRKEIEKIETDNRFLQHDLAQEFERTRKIDGSRRSRTAPSAVLRETPRKSKRQAIGDGFDNDQIHLASPTKSKEKPKDDTHRVGAKRKRPVGDSPAALLSFTEPPQPVRREDSPQTAVSSGLQDSKNAVVQKDERYEYMQLILSHTLCEGHERTLEALLKYSYPSRPEQSLSSVFMDGVTSACSANLPLPIVVSHVLLDMWGRCLVERWFDPFHLILDMLRFALRFQLAAIKAQLIEQAVPLCGSCIDMIPVTLGKASKNHSYAANLDRTALDKLAENLVVDEIVTFLHDMCDSASLSMERSETFWRTIDFHTVLILLSKVSPINQIVAMLEMLASSVRPLSFSVIHEDPAKQREHERSTIDCLTNLLFEVPAVPKNEPLYGEEEILQLRSKVLQILNEICQTDHGTVQVVQHRSAIGRLVRFLDAQVSKLYRVRPSLGNHGSTSRAHELVTELVNVTSCLLYHLLKSFDDAPSINQKLRAVLGGYHKFVVALTRVAFSEQMVFEAGIRDSATEAAHAILDNFLGPEDGEAVMEAFETPRGAKVSPTECRTIRHESTEDRGMAMDEHGGDSVSHTA